jgi:hypothetical protein
MHAVVDDYWNQLRSLFETLDRGSVTNRALETSNPRPVPGPASENRQIPPPGLYWPHAAQKGEQSTKGYAGRSLPVA